MKSNCLQTFLTRSTALACAFAFCLVGICLDASAQSTAIEDWINNGSPVQVDVGRIAETDFDGEWGLFVGQVDRTEWASNTEGYGIAVILQSINAAMEVLANADPSWCADIYTVQPNLYALAASDSVAFRDYAQQVNDWLYSIAIQQSASYEFETSYSYPLQQDILAAILALQSSTSNALADNLHQAQDIYGSDGNYDPDADGIIDPGEVVPKTPSELLSDALKDALNSDLENRDKKQDERMSNQVLSVTSPVEPEWGIDMSWYESLPDLPQEGSPILEIWPVWTFKGRTIPSLELDVSRSGFCEKVGSLMKVVYGAVFFYFYWLLAVKQYNFYTSNGNTEG